jgi:hypothetical protein
LERESELNAEGAAERARFVISPTVSGSIRLGSLFFTLPTRRLTGQQIIAGDG